MDPEILKYALNWGFPAVLIFYGIWFFQTQAWPNFVKHLDKVGEMIDAFTATKENGAKTFEVVTRIDGHVEELLARVPKRNESREREAS